jgi:hypothetical protein
MGHQPVRPRATGHGPPNRHGGTHEAPGSRVGHGLHGKDHVRAEGQGSSVTLLRPDGTQYPGSPFTGDGLPPGRGPWLWTAMTTSGFPISRCPTARSRSSAACAPRTARPASRPANRSHRRRLRGRRSADADGPRYLAFGRRTGDEQLAGYRQLPQNRQRGALDALRRSRRRNLLRHGEARPCAANWPGTGAGRGMMEKKQCTIGSRLGLVAFRHCKAVGRRQVSAQDYKTRKLGLLMRTGGTTALGVPTRLEFPPPRTGRSAEDRKSCPRTWE